MMMELKRRDISWIYIFYTFPGEEKRQPTCIEDCQPETRHIWCMSKGEDDLRETVKMLAGSLNELCDFLLEEKAMTEEQGNRFRDMIKTNMEWIEHDMGVQWLADKVDFFCEKIVMLADACGVERGESAEVRDED